MNSASQVIALQVAVLQLNLTVGDLSGNVQRIMDGARAAYAQGARLVLTPEQSVCGYPAEDLLLRSVFVSACEDKVMQIARELADLPGLYLVVGHPQGGGQRSKSVAVQKRHNAASVLCEGRVVAVCAKRELPNYQVFDERRYFEPGQAPCVFAVPTPQGEVRVGLLICEDAWFEGPAREAKAAGAQLLAVINASPWHVGKGLERERCMQERVAQTGLALVYAHCVGGQDEVVFEGRSFGLTRHGTLAFRAPSFIENMQLASVFIDFDAIDLIASEVAPEREPLADLWDALVLGVRDYLGKNRFSGALLGLSGGIDSALVLALAVDALGKDRVRAVMMPSPYTADISSIDARDMAARLGVQYDEISIAPQFEAFKASLAVHFEGRGEDTTEENIQARVRGTLLMALSNKLGSIVLTTGNKSEMATGYCTLYGDMAGGFAVIKDVAKTTVFELCRWRNQHDPHGTGANPIPERIITRPPSAELRANQTDQDSLPEYAVLDAILERYMENDDSIESIVAAGFLPADVERVTRLIQINEYKRRQSPVGIRVTHRSFGKDWRYPITNRFRA